VRKSPFSEESKNYKNPTKLTTKLTKTKAKKMSPLFPIPMKISSRHDATIATVADQKEKRSWSSFATEEERR